MLFNLLLLYLHVSNVTRFDDAKIQTMFVTTKQTTNFVC
nr:MAG TPA: hypothetical protein [Caudoviricetes sp.]